MNQKLIAILGLSLLAGGASIRAQDDTNAPSSGAVTRNTFQIIGDRNIFDPNRRPSRRGNNGPVTTREYFKLTGVMSYDDKAYAFFDGSGGGNRSGAYQLNDKINGYTIVGITNNAVKLSVSNQVVTMVGGAQMAREVTRDPRAGGGGETRTPWKMVAGSVVSSDSDPADKADDGAVDDVMKRLIERRKAEENASGSANGGIGTNEIHE
jgi:hypothetical protein